MTKDTAVTAVQQHTAAPACDAHELRLQELFKLAQQQQETQPGPGHYQTVPASAFSHRGARRPHTQPLDGPFPLHPGQASTRAHQLDSVLLLKDSGLGPAVYDDSSSRRATAPRAATTKIGTACRTPSAVGPGQVCISLSRSLAAGLDWREQLTLAHIQQHVAAAAAGWGAQRGARPATAAATTAATGFRLGSAQPGRHSCSTGSSTGGQPVGDPASQEQLHSAEETKPAHSTVLGCCDNPKQQQQQQQQPADVQSTTHQLCGQAQYADSSQQQHGSRPQLPPEQQQDRSVLQRRPATTGSSSVSSSRRPSHAGCLPWQLAASLSQQEHALQALMARRELQQQQGTTGHDAAGLHEQPCAGGTTNSPHLDSEQQQQCQQQQTPAGRPVVVVLQQQEVLQHQSAARAASAAQQLAARRQQWADLSTTCPPPYPVFLQGTPDSPAH